MTHISNDILKSQIETGYKVVKKGGVYSHYKTPSSRCVLEKLIIIEATEEVAVIYSPVGNRDITFVRPLSEWLEEVDRVPRFTLVGEDS